MTRIPHPSDVSVSLTLPPRWATRSDPGHGVVVAARSREAPPSGFAPEIVVRSVPVDDDLVGWRQEALAAMRHQLEGFELEDEDLFDLGDHEVLYRRFSHRLVGTDLVCEQWAWVVAGAGVTLTASVARVDYPTYCDLFEDVAATVEVARPTAA